MSDTMSADTGAAEVPAAPADTTTTEALTQAAEVPAAAPEAPAPKAPEADEVDLDAEPSDDLYADPTKAKALVKKLREENAKNRVKAKEATAPFEGWSESDAKVLAEVIQTAAQDPKVGAAKMREIAALLDGGDIEGAAEVAAEASEAAASVLTPEDVESKIQAALAEADKQRAIETRRDEIISQAKEFGYEVGSDDYFTLLHIATNKTGGNLAKAHEAIEARNQAIIDKYVGGVRERSAAMPIHGGKPEDSVIDPSGENKTWDSARSRTEQRLVNLRKR